MAQGHKVWLWVRSPLEDLKCLFKFIFPFLRFIVEAKRGVEFRHSARNAFTIRWKVLNGVSVVEPICVFLKFYHSTGDVSILD